MKRETLRHPKTYDLASRLGVSRPHALGLLELLWDYTSEVAPQGDIGKWPDGAIARSCDWEGDPEEFIRALVDSGWLDRCEVNRLVIHDIADHAQQWWKQKVSKLKLAFVTAVTTEVPKVRPAVATAVTTAEGTQVETVGSTVAAPSRDRTEPNRTEPNPSECSLDFQNREVLWGTEPIGWLAFDWMDAQRHFLEIWNQLPGVIKSSMTALPADLESQFRERWQNSEWRAICRKTFAKITAGQGLQSGTKLNLKRWLSEESLADVVLNGTYDFSKGAKSNGDPLRKLKMETVLTPTQQKWLDKSRAKAKKETDE